MGLVEIHAEASYFGVPQQAVSDSTSSSGSSNSSCNSSGKRSGEKWEGEPTHSFDPGKTNAGKGLVRWDEICGSKDDGRACM